MNRVDMQSTGVEFHPDSRRVLVRPFISADDDLVRHIIDRALALDESEVDAQLAGLRVNFASRHLDIEASWRRHYAMVSRHLAEGTLSAERELLIGALFSGEYALESAALFNPSIVAHPDQNGLAPGALRFVLSLRATGEGHISSIEFRSGILGSDGAIQVDEISSIVTAAEVVENPTYRKSIFVDKLSEMDFDNDWTHGVMTSLGRNFTHAELEQTMRDAMPAEGTREIDRTRECINWLAKSNYEVHFPATVPLSQRIIFPVSANESNGIEDARFVRFVEDDGAVCYYATYTAYNGRAILPQLIETEDFQNFRVLTLNGRAVQNKGMALFPRRVNGLFSMISRQDDRNLHIMVSDNLHFWDDPKLLRTPCEQWESVKIGNCGSPIETPDGWLLITHGVGPMRRYCIGALLLDLEDPARVIGSLREPLLEPTDQKREGYVPNVVYSCGAITHGGRLILPYAVSDTSSTVATADLSDLLALLKSN